MAGLIPWGELDAAADITTGANIDRPASRSQRAVDDRINTQVVPLVTSALADDETVIEAVQDAVADAASSLDVLTKRTLLESLADSYGVELAENLTPHPGNGIPHGLWVIVGGTGVYADGYTRNVISSTAETIYAARIETGTVSGVRLPVTPGAVLSASAEARTSSGLNLLQRIGWLNSAGTLIHFEASTVTPTSTGWTLLTPLEGLEAPAGAAYVIWSVGLDAGARSVGDTLDMRNLTIDEHHRWRGIISGNLSNGFWMGSPNISKARALFVPTSPTILVEDPSNPGLYFMEEN